MAQYFFDFKDWLGKKGIPPAFERWYPGFGSLNSFSQELYGIPGGILEHVYRVNTDSDFSDGLAVFGLKGITATDAECLVKLRCWESGDAAYTNGGPTFNCRFSDILGARFNGYQLATHGGPNKGGVYLRKWVDGSSSSSTMSTSIIPNVSLYDTWIRWQVAGDKLRWKGWVDGDSEPASWGREVTDSDISGAGYLGFTIPECRNPRIYQLYQLSFGTDGDPAPASYPGGHRQISGVITDDSGSSAGRIVRIYHRTTGVLLTETVSDPITGEYNVSLTTADEINRVVLDDDGGELYNDLIDRVIPG